MVACTRPSTTRVSQSSISPLTLMLGPTVSLLPLSSAATGALLETEEGYWAGLLTLVTLPPVDVEEMLLPALLLLNGELVELVSRLPKRDSERSMGSPEIDDALSGQVSR